MIGRNAAAGRAACAWKVVTILIAAMLVTACSSATATPTPTLTPTTTLAPTVTATSVVTPTATTAAATPVSPAPTLASTPFPEPTLAEPTPSPSQSASVEPSPSPIASPSPSPEPSASPSPSEPPSGLVQVVAGGGEADPSNGGPATAVKLNRPLGIAVAPDGSIWIVETNAGAARVVGLDGSIRTATKRLLQPVGIAVAPNGTAYVADTSDYRVVSVLDAGKVGAVAGILFHAGFKGDGGLAKRALLFEPYDVAIDAAGNLYIADAGNSRIRVVDAKTKRIHTIAGDGKFAFGGDGGPATHAQLQRPEAIEVDSAGTTLYIADTRNNRIRSVDLASGVITTIGGSGTFSASFVPGATGLQTPMNHLNTIALDHEGNLYMVVLYGDLGNVVMKMPPSGAMTRVAGGGKAVGDGVAPLDFALPNITALAIEPSTGALLMTSNEGLVYRVTGVTTPVAS